MVTASEDRPNPVSPLKFPDGGSARRGRRFNRSKGRAGEFGKAAAMAFGRLAGPRECTLVIGMRFQSHWA